MHTAGSTLNGETYIVQFNENNGDPIPGVQCWVTADSNGDIPLTDVRFSDNLGKVFFLLAPGNYFLFALKRDYNFTNPTAITVL
jgi:hypothetical protein